MIESALGLRTDKPAQTDGAAAWTHAMGQTAARMKGHLVQRYDLNDRMAGPMPAFAAMMAPATQLSAQNMADANHAGAKDSMPAASDGGDYSFLDVVDMVNPFQHIPVLNTIYRNFTGDTIKPISQIIGGSLFGGPVGAVSSTANVIIKNRTGKDIAENVFALAAIPLGGRASAPRPDITYAPPPIASLEGTTIALANLSAGNGHNFARREPPDTPWNA